MGRTGSEMEDLGTAFATIAFQASLACLFEGRFYWEPNTLYFVDLFQKCGSLTPLTVPFPCHLHIKQEAKQFLIGTIHYTLFISSF
jgi:hypothetical protein